MGPKTEPTRSTLGGVLKHTTIRVPYVLLSEPQFPHFHRVVLRMEGEAVCGGSRTVPGPGLALLPACAGVLARSPGETGGRSIVGTPGTGPPGEQWPVSLGCYGLMSSMLRLLKKQKEKKKKNRAAASNHTNRSGSVVSKSGKSPRFWGGGGGYPSRDRTCLSWAPHFSRGLKALGLLYRVPDLCLNQQYLGNDSPREWRPRAPSSDQTPYPAPHRCGARWEPHAPPSQLSVCHAELLAHRFHTRS